MLNPFRTITTLDRLTKQIRLTEEALISNTHNAEHFAAAAEGNRKQLTKLRAMRSQDLGDAAGALVAKAPVPSPAAPMKVPKPHLAATK